MEAKSNLPRPSVSAEVVLDSEDKPPKQAASSHHLLCTNKDPAVCATCSGAFEGGQWRMACCGSIYCASCDELSSHLQYDEKSAKLCAVCRKKAPITDRDVFRMTLLAARKGEAWAQFDVARSFEKGHGVDQSHSEAVCWYKKAAEQGHPKAFVNLGVKYEDGEGCTADPFEAERYYWMAIDLPIEFHKRQKYLGVHNLANLFQGQGRGEEARDLLLPFVAEGNADIQNTLGVVYDNTLSNDEEAASWYESAAMQGHSQAAQNLVWSYMCLGRHTLAKFWINIVIKIVIGMREGTLVANMKALRRDEEHCGACDEKLGTPKQNMCKQCRTYCYCNRLCQIRHWNREHKIDCKEARDLKEEEVLASFKNAPDDWYEFENY